MERLDVIVVGAGISGLAFAWKAAQDGKKVLVLEREERVGGCIHSVRREDGYWYELGAHTAYNSYGAFLDIAVGTGVARDIIERGPARSRFGLVRDGQYKWLTPPKILLQLNWLEAALSAPFGFFRSKEGQTIKSYYGGLVGRRNYERLFSPFFAAVPSQSADGFPVDGPGSLFKKRPRREEFIRSFGFKGGLSALCEAAAKTDGVTVETGVTVRKVARAGAGFAVTTADGRTLEAAVVAMAAPSDAAAAMLGEGFPEVRRQLERVKTVVIDSHGVVLPRDKCWMPEVAFVVPADDVFHSAVTRDPFPDPRFRAFAFHFKSGLTREDRIRRLSEVLRLAPEALGEITDQRLVLPSPALGHADVVQGLDAALAGGRLALTGNYFAGLAIEDCVLRSNEEWRRVKA